MTGTPGYQHWLEQADGYAASGTLDRVYTDLALAEREYVGDRQQAGLELFQRALVLARQLDDHEALYQAGFRAVSSRLPAYQEERLRLAQEFGSAQQGRASARTFGVLLLGIFHVSLARGDRVRAEDARRRLREVAARTKDSQILFAPLYLDLVFTAIDGRLEAAVQEGEQYCLRAAELGAPGPARLNVFTSTLRPLCYLGRAEEALAAQPDASRTAVAEGRSLVFAGDSALFLAHLGRWDEVRDLLGRLSERMHTADESFELSYAPLTNYLEAAVLAQDRELAALIRPRLTPVSGLINEVFPTVIARHLGAASALLGERERARQYYEQALEVAGRVRFRPEIALTHLQLAELLLEDGDKAQRTEALAHLDFAIAELREMKMQPALKRALRHKEVLRA